MTADIRIAEKVKDDNNAQILETIPGIGKFTALMISSEIGSIDRFVSSDKLVAYFGLVPSRVIWQFNNLTCLQGNIANQTHHRI